MKVKNDIEFNKLKKNNTSGTGATLIKFMTAWSEYMENEIDNNGKKLEDIVLESSMIVAKQVGVSQGGLVVTSAHSLDIHWQYGGKVHESLAKAMGFDKEE